MSEVSCTACQELREDAPEFVTRGVTSKVCNSLANDTGLDATNGNNDATDLHTANDCLIGRMEDEINSYDTCDWKKFMKLFNRNIYEMLKAIICALRGIWLKIHNHEARIAELEDGGIEDFCDVTDNIMELALHRLHGTAHTKVKADLTSDGGMLCNTVTAEYCGKTATIDMVALSIDVGTVESIQNGDILYTIEKSDVVPSLMHNSTWVGIMRNGFMQSLCTVEGKWVVYAVAAEREEYPDKLSISVHSTVGPTQVASGNVATIQNTPRFFIIS